MQQVFFQGLAFLNAEAIDGVQGLVEGFADFGDESLVVVLGRNVENTWHFEQNARKVAALWNAELG